MLLILLVVSAQGAWAISGEWKDNAATAFASGSGTKEDPYVIKTAAQLAYLAKEVSNTQNASLNKYYVLGDNIDLSAHYWNPIGDGHGYNGGDGDTNYRFKGNFDGRGYTIKNMHLQWVAGKTWTATGLFGIVLGQSNNWACVKNLIIDNSKVERKSGDITDKYYMIGILAGEVREYSEISNIIVKNSVMSDGGSAFNVKNSAGIRFGGLIGNTSQNKSDKFRIFNLAAEEVTVDFSHMTYNSKSAYSYIGAIISRFKQTKGTDANCIFAKNVFSGVTIKFEQKQVKNGQVKRGNVFAIDDGEKEPDNWYYTTSLPELPNNNSVNYGQKKDIAFGSTFIAQTNDFLLEKEMSDSPCWGYGQTTGFVFIGTLSDTHESTHLTNAHVYTMNTTGSYAYEWYVDGVRQSSTTNSAALPTKAVKQTGRVVVKNGTETLLDKTFVIPAEIYGVEDHICAPSYGGGRGTESAPYLISNDSQLARLAFDINNGRNLDKYYKITADIDLENAIWTPIGSIAYDANKTFKGMLDGNGHTINNMHFDWFGTKKDVDNSIGLFSTIGGGNIRNLIIDNAHGKCDNNSDLMGSSIVGVLAGSVLENSYIQNIIIRNSEITGTSSAFNQNGKLVVIGGAIGKIVDKNDSYKFENIATDVEINLNSLTLSNPERVYVGGFIAECQSNVKTCVKNVYAHGSITVDTSCENVGSVFGLNYSNVSMETLYYAKSANHDQGTQKSLSGFAVPFCDANNDYIESSGDDALSSWNYNKSDGIFFFTLYGTELTVDYKSNVVITANTLGLDGSEQYNWYISEDKVTWKKSDLSSTNTLSLPYEGNMRYVYAELADESSRSKSVKISTIITADAYLTKTNGTYGVTLTNSLWNDDNQYLTVSYQWMVNGSVVSEATSETYTPSVANAKVACRVTLGSGGYTIFDKTLYSGTVVFVKPDGGNDNNDGLTPDTPVKTWQKAYSKLKDGVSWDENTIVLMGLSNEAATGDQGGFAVTQNIVNNVPSELYASWKAKVDASHLAKNATITGKYNGVDYGAIIEGTSYSGRKYISLFGDTRFEHITFHHTNSAAGDGGNHSQYIFCQYYNLEMGEGIQMTGFVPEHTPGYGTVDGARIASFQIYGGLNNDARFRSGTGVLDMEAMEKAMPHGKEGFSITLKSGHYSTITVGGRQSTGSQINGLMGTPNMPIKCTVTIDIDREFNDTHNEAKADYDCGIVLAGCHEGAMYADVDVVLKSGYVGRVVNGSLGHTRSYNFNYGGNNYIFPSNTYAGRANILLDPRDGEGKIDNNKVIVTELYGGSTGRGYSSGDKIDNPFYGNSTVTINGGTFKILPASNANNSKLFCGIFGSGAGGYNGIGDDTHHTVDQRIAYWSNDNKVVLFGNYEAAKNRLVSVKCYNEKGEPYSIDPRDTNTKVIINDGVFGSETQKIDGVYAGGSGFMSPSLFFTNNVTPSTAGGNVYGKTGADADPVSTLIINGGKFYCKHGVFAGGRGAVEYYSQGAYSGTPANYTDLGKTYGNVKLEITGGTFNCDVFGGGYGVADAKLKGDNTNTYTTLNNMARVYGKTAVKIGGNAVINGSVYGGGDMAVIENGTSDAAVLSIEGNAVVKGSVFASGNGRRYNANATDDNYTRHPELVGSIIGNAKLTISGTPKIYGDIFGGGAYGSTTGNTTVTANGGSFWGNVYGGGQGDLTTNTKATVTGNATVTMGGAKSALGEGETASFADGLHNIYGGGYLVADVQGKASVNVTRGFAGSDIIATQMWQNAYANNTHRNFCVYGGGYGANTSVGSTAVNINIDIDEENIVLASVGGSYAGEVKGNTSTTIQGTPILRGVYGGGYGTNDNATTGIVRGNTFLNIRGGKIYSNVYGGGAGLGSKTATYKDVARVYGNTNVTVTGTAAVYGSVFGGGDLANVGDESKTVNYSTMPTSKTAIDANGQIGDYTSKDYNTFVNITGGNVFGMVFGGGNGRLKADALDYKQVGRVRGNTLVHVSSSVDNDNKTVEPYIWNRIYGGGSYGTVDGNSMVHIEGGYLGHNIFGGGYGDASTDKPETATGSRKGTYADILGNTNVTIDGGSWLWYAKADAEGNITTWDKAITKISTPFEELRNLSVADRMALVQSNINPDFFGKNDTGYGFVTNHNIYGGGRAACYVGQDGNTNTGTSKVVINHSPLTDVMVDGKKYDLLDLNTVAGCCWYSSADNTRQPQFSVFGAGYGMNTKVKNTEVLAQPGAQLDATGNMMGYKYRNQMADLLKYVAFEQAIYDKYQAVDDDTRRKMYGMGENTDDPRTYLRYRASQLAWSVGAPSFAFMDIHGGGFSGYVTENTKVITDCQLACRSVFGGGIGSKPENPSGNETYGQVGGNTDVKIYGGFIAMNVFGGGVGIESYKVGGQYKDFPEMARVMGKTNVDVYGESYKISYLANRDVERTLIFGSVYGGGDVANVGTSAATAAKLNGTETFTTKVNILGASVMSAVYAGGNGRSKAMCKDYTKVGAVYGNTGLFVNKADKAYPYTSSTAPSTDIIPYLWNRAYGGGNKGVVHGNTLVKTDSGYFSDDIFAGGLGEVGTDAAHTTSANVEGNTNIIINGGEAKLTSLWKPAERSWTAATKSEGNNHLYSPQYDPTTKKFKVNHNVYGGGNLACTVSGNSYITMTKGMLNNQETVSATPNPEGGFFATLEWKEVYEKTGTPYFCVFGGGYGDNTVISGNTNVSITMAETGSVTIGDIPDRVEGEEYLHFIPGQSVMDIVGGGFEGKVNGETNVTIDGGTFARRVFGGGHYNSVNKSNVNIKAIDCQDVFGGGMMGDVEKTVNVNIGVEGAADDIHIHGNVYGGNDVAGYVNLKDEYDSNGVVFEDNGGEGVKVTIRGGHIYGNIYGAGNGDYLYALDKANNTKPTVNEYYKSEKNIYDLVFTVPMRSTIASNISSATDAQKIVNLNSWRPLTNKVTLSIEGKSATSKPIIGGYVYGGGNSATVVKTDANSHVTLNVGSNIELGGLFLGCDGDQLFTQTEHKDYMRAIKDIDGIDLNASINWNLAANKNISEIYVPADNESRPKAYPHILDLYFQPVAMSIRPVIKWCVDASGTAHPENLKNTIIGSFVCGGNRGNMDVMPDAAGNAVNIEFPEGLIITDKIVGGCYNANYDKNNTITVNHVGGYLLGTTHSASPMINLLVKCKLLPSVVEKNGKNYYEGGNVYGGCYKSGIIVGDVKIDYRSNTLKDLDEKLLATANENDIAACNVYGAGFGESSYVYGDINVLYANQVKSSVSGSTYTGTTVNNIFGGGQKGNVIGNTDIRILNGKVLGSVTGGSYSGNLWGSTQVLVGYPTYYLCKKSAKYDLLRADDSPDNVAMKNKDINGVETPTIKQSVYIMKGDIVSEQVVDAIKAKNSGLQISNLFEKKTTTPSYSNGWNDVNIQIGVAVYGGGYSTSASGSSALTNTTVLRYTDKYNNISLDYSTAKTSEGKGDFDLDEVAVKNYGGNTTMLIADDPSYNAEHITISPQTMKVATGLNANSDLFRYYYKDVNNEYHYISEEGKYFKKGPWPEDIHSTDHNFYVADTEGGIFGDGHLSYTEGFRNCELTGYGYASHTINAGKILNTFQRMDMLRLKDNCVKLLGARDYATNSTDVTPYSISRVGEIQMMSSVDGSQPLYPGEKDEKERKRSYTQKKVRNYLGLSNNIRYVGAIKTDDEFSTALWHDKEGKLGTAENGYVGKSYRYVKDDFLKYHEFVGNDYPDKNEITYQKRNEGTARNLIGIASGYSLKIRNVQEQYDSNGKLTETAFYGPIVGVAEIRLVDINADEAGGYVYADNRHSKESANGYHNFLEETGNFVFPYIENPDMFVVDDCFPNGWEHYNDKGMANADQSHCWFLTGYHFYLNANISAYTYNSADEAKSFESNSEIDLQDVEILKGLMAGQELTIESWDLRSDQPDSFDSDLEIRNYKNGEHDHSENDMMGKYKLFVSISDKKEYTETEGVHYELSMKKDASIAKGTPIPGAISADISRLAFKLVDNVDNTSTEYYEKHMELPTKAALVLRTPALRLNPNYGQPGEPRTVPDKSKMAISVFYTKSGENYVQTPFDQPLHVGTTYYFRNADTQDYEVFYNGSTFLNDVFVKTNDKYSNPLAITDIMPTNSNVFYLDVPRSYTYTIYLNIEYIQGPSPEGNITIANCALPGEYIKVDASSVTIAADQSMRPQSFYWRIGKLNADGTNFKDAWKKDESSATYDTWRVGSEEKTGIFAHCEAEGDNVLYVPAYYYMNGYGVQYGFTSRKGNDEVSGDDDDIYNFFPIDMKRDEKGKVLDRLEIHNYHRMDSHAADVNLHLAEAVERAKDEPSAQPRIYIADEADLKAFSTFVSSNKYKGANAQFVLQNDLTIPSGYEVPAEFKGTLHGDGYVITGESLFKKNSGNVYNLGMASGKIASDGNTNTGKYHCCFEFNGKNVYDNDGTLMSDYSADDFKFGRVAYDLNQYSIKKGENALGDDTYVEDYYRNGDYQYARIVNENSGVTYLRKGNDLTGDLTLPRYYMKDQTAHDMEHTADVRQNGDHCEPLFNTNGMNDYRYFGQYLQAEPALFPSAITSHKNEAALNRVWRTEGYYNSNYPDKFYYNAAIYNDDYMDTYVLDPSITAVNFNVDDDNATKFHGFGTAENVTRNLLVYTANPTSANNEVADVVAQTLSYDEAMPEGGIRGHHIVPNGQNWKTPLLHLVDKQTFNAPIKFTVTGRSWYVRHPETETGYVEKVGYAWESICLPFEVKKSILSDGIQMYKESDGSADKFINEITFFYGEPAANTTVANNNNTLRHHYWFRELEAVEGNQATFSRPAKAISDGGFAAYRPYIVSFPGSRYYEFDMTGQTITFENDANATINVTDDANVTAFSGPWTFISTFANEEPASNKYAIEIGDNGEDMGSKFEKNKPIYAFRAYMRTGGSHAKAMAKSFTPDLDAIYISTDIRNIENLNEDENSADVAGEYLRVYDAGNHTIGVESSYETKLTIYNAAGQIARILDVRPGTSKYSGFASGIYIIGKKKLPVK